MNIDIVSDLHGFYPDLEGGDLLIVAGDLTARDTKSEYIRFIDWIVSQKYTRKIVIAGNHDTALQKNEDFFHENRIDEYFDFDYLCNSGTEFMDYYSNENNALVGRCIKIWGSPWTKTFEGMNPNCKAFTVDTDEELAKQWALIPDDTEILITHCPPHGIFDNVTRKELDKFGNTYQWEEYTGSKSLRNHVMGRIKPKIHVFGHIHEWGGRMLDTGVTKFINASHVNERYEPVNKPIRVIL
jgi:Icc-related predicted phosphoesterase